jgi:hypothetical protein
MWKASEKQGLSSYGDLQAKGISEYLPFEPALCYILYEPRCL